MENDSSVGALRGLAESRGREACHVCTIRGEIDADMLDIGDATANKTCLICGFQFKCCSECFQLPCPASNRHRLNLPEPWVETKDEESGRMYFWNQVTNETSWESPCPFEFEPIGTETNSVDSASDVLAHMHSCTEEPEPEDQRVPRLVLLWDLNEALLYRPWVKQPGFSTEIEGACAHCSKLGVGRSGHAKGVELRMYHRPHTKLVFDEMIGKCSWGFYTTMARVNAISLIKNLFRHDLQAKVIDLGGFRMQLEYQTAEGGTRQEYFLLFDMTDCTSDGQIPQPFDLTIICEKADLQRSCVVLVTAVEDKCRLGNCRDHWLPCSLYKERQVCDPLENGLELVRMAIRRLTSCPPQEVLGRLQTIREQLLAGGPIILESHSTAIASATASQPRGYVVVGFNAVAHVIRNPCFRIGSWIIGIFFVGSMLRSFRRKPQ